MPVFEYTAKNATTGQIMKGSLDAPSRDEVVGHLRKNRMLLVSLREAPKEIKFTLPGAGRISTRDVVIFTRQFATMINSGLPLVQSLNILSAQTESAKLKDVCKGVVSGQAAYAARIQEAVVPAIVSRQRDPGASPGWNASRNFPTRANCGLSCAMTTAASIPRQSNPRIPAFVQVAPRVRCGGWTIAPKRKITLGALRRRALGGVLRVVMRGRWHAWTERKPYNSDLLRRLGVLDRWD